MDADLDHTDSIEQEFSALRKEPIHTYAERLLQLKLTSKHFHDRYIHMNGVYMKTVKSDRDKEIKKNPLGKKTFQRIKGASGSGLNALKRKVAGPLGQKIGTHTTDAYEICKNLMDAWADVYEGNAASHKDLVKAFKGKYGHLLFKRKEKIN